jgi:hypothetical protein
MLSKELVVADRSANPGPVALSCESTLDAGDPFVIPSKQDATRNQSKPSLANCLPSLTPRKVKPYLNVSISSQSILTRALALKFWVLPTIGQLGERSKFRTPY